MYISLIILLLPFFSYVRNGTYLLIPGLICSFLHSMQRGYVLPFSCSGFPTLYGMWVFNVLSGNDIPAQKEIIYGLIPVGAILLFCLHPVGQIAWMYSLYWLTIPFAFLIPLPSLFKSSMVTVMSSHAVGSVWYLYMAPTTPEYWMTLCTIVWYERLLLTVGMMVIHAIIKRVDMVYARFQA